MSENYICIGDIHGRFDLLTDLLGQIDGSPYKGFRKVFMGDMIDRGPDSFKVVETVKKLTETTDAIALLGNHEDWMMEIVRSGMSRDSGWFYSNNGGMKTIDSYGKATG